MSISCNRLIFRRKHPFALKLVGYSKDHAAYIWQKFQLEIPSFTRDIGVGFLDFQNPKIPNPPFPP
jgi:hypothetical protein